MAYKIEILMSTMFRTDLTFLEPIFKKNKHFSNYNIIVVNQTDKDKLLRSDYDSVKTINSFERGSPASRNLAISVATGDICLMADDDIVYEAGFDTLIQQAYNENPDADFISFESINEFGHLRVASLKEDLHNKKTLKSISTIVISFKNKVYKKNKLLFNHYFGLGSVFKGVTEYPFLRNAYDMGLKMFHVNRIIVMHPEESSGRNMGSDNAFYARAAAAQRFYGNFSYIWLLKYTFFTIRHNHIKFNHGLMKFKIGLRGISKYKALKRSGEIDKIYDYKIY